MTTTKETYTVMVLNDGSTYSSVDGCEIITITQKALDMLEQDGYEPKDIPGDEVLLSVQLTQNDAF